MRGVVYDVNVVLDVLLQRQPHVGVSARALDAATDDATQGYLAAHAITTLFYLLQREIGATQARAALGHLLEQLQVAPVDDGIVRRALIGGFPDFEDGVTAEAARAVGATCIVTRNGKDFAASEVPAVHPAAFIP